MSWKHLTILLVALGSALASASPLKRGSGSAEGGIVALGSAYSVKGDQQLLYRESYGTMNTRGEVLVEYTRPEGAVMARKTLHFGKDPKKPGFELVDFRTNQRLGALWRKGQLVLIRDGRNGLREKPITPMSPVVIDAGIGYFIPGHWDKLTAGERVQFNFAFPSRLTSTLLVVEEVAGEDSPLYQENEAWRYFRVEVANRLKALFTDATHLAFSEQDKRLMAYQGRSDLERDDGGSWDVRILYEYP